MPLSFGLTSGVITTLGLMTGLYSGTHSKMIIFSGILIIALADSLSDTRGVHTAEESEGKHSTREIWEATLATFLFKLLVAATFTVPFLFLTIKTAIIVNFAWGALLLTSLSSYLAKKERLKIYLAVTEHLAIAILIIICTYFIGKIVAGL